MPDLLSRVLAEIDPRRTFDEVARCMDRVMETRPRLPSVVRDWQEFCMIIVDVYMHLEGATFKPPRLLRSGVFLQDMGRCSDAMDKIFGRDGMRVAFGMASRGVGGGLRAVLNTMAKGMAEMEAERRIADTVERIWFSLPFQGKVLVIRQYLQQFGHLLAPDVIERIASDIHGFPKVLCHHPRIIQRRREMGQE